MIDLSHIVKRFGDNTVLKDVSISFGKGSVTALVGPSGSGKSTLLRCINLLEVPTSGTLTINDASASFAPGQRLDRRTVHAIRRQTGMIFQNFQLFPHRTALGNVAEGLTAVLKWPEAKARERAMALLDKVGLAHKAEAWPSTLSGGQQQRVAIARALAPSPEVLLCDEPTSALDPELAQEVVEVLAQIAREGTTMVIATHDLRLAQTVAQEALFLDDGVIVERGPSEALFSHPEKDRTRRFIASILSGR